MDARAPRARPGQGDRGRRLLVGVDEGRAVRAVPVRRPGLRARKHRPAGRLHLGRRRRPPGRLLDLDKLRRRAARQARPRPPGLAADLHRLQLQLLLLHRAQRDGHNITKLVDTLKDLKDIPGPKLLHIKTVKGKGYELAEKDQTKWHAPGLFDKITGEIYKKKFDIPQPPKYQDVFGYTIIELAEKNDKIMGVTPAMPSGCSLKYMMEKMPDRAFDVGICEQHAVTLSAGLATQGMKVFCNIYSSFMQRAYDQVMHDVAIQKLPVVFCLDRAGLVGEDGPTHHGAYDIAYMRCIPNMIVSAPMNESELRDLMYTAQLDSTKNPFVIRYPRGEAVKCGMENRDERN